MFCSEVRQNDCFQHFSWLFIQYSSFQLRKHALPGGRFPLLFSLFSFFHSSINKHGSVLDSKKYQDTTLLRKKKKLQKAIIFQSSSILPTNRSYCSCAPLGRAYSSFSMIAMPRVYSLLRNNRPCENENLSKIRGIM